MKNLTVILPSMRVEKAIPSLTSVLSQKGVSLVSVIITGASCNREEFRKRCTALSPRIMLGGPYPKDIMTPGKARNDGLDLLYKNAFKPDYVMFCDDDIVLPQDYASKLIAFVESADNVTAAMGRIVSRPERYWTRVLDYSNFWWLQVEYDITDLGWLGAGATLLPLETVRGFRYSESLTVNEDTDFFRRIAAKSGGRLGICSNVTGFHLQERMKLMDLVRVQYRNGSNSRMEFYSRRLTVRSVLLGLRNVASLMKRTCAANRGSLISRPQLLAGIFLSFVCYEAGILTGISRLDRDGR